MPSSLMWCSMTLSFFFFFFEFSLSLLILIVLWITHTHDHWILIYILWFAFQHVSINLLYKIRFHVFSFRLFFFFVFSSVCYEPFLILCLKFSTLDNFVLFALTLSLSRWFSLSHSFVFFLSLSLACDFIFRFIKQKDNKNTIYIMDYYYCYVRRGRRTSHFICVSYIDVY